MISRLRSAFSNNSLPAAAHTRLRYVIVVYVIFLLLMMTHQFDRDGGYPHVQNQ
jgi:hypothetical protein